jgi:hypothetical protein
MYTISRRCINKKQVCTKMHVAYFERALERNICATLIIFSSNIRVRSTEASWGWTIANLNGRINRTTYHLELCWPKRHQFLGNENYNRWKASQGFHWILWSWSQHTTCWSCDRSSTPHDNCRRMSAHCQYMRHGSIWSTHKGYAIWDEVLHGNFLHHQMISPHYRRQQYRQWNTMKNLWSWPLGNSVCWTRGL